MKRFGTSQHLVFLSLALLGVMGGFYIAQKTILTEAAPGINKTINFQGKMTDDQGLNVADGNYQFVFSLYTVASGGSSTWTETVNLDVSNGIFHHALGSDTALPGGVDFNTDNIYLGITFNSDPDGEMSPRIQLAASPYAFNSDMLDGLDAEDFVQLNPSVAQTGDIAITGEIEAGSAVLSGDIAVNGGDITSSGALTIQPNAGSNLNVILATTGDLAVNTNQLYIDTSAGNVGIGTSNPSVAKLQVETGNAQAGLFQSALTGAGNTVNIQGTLSRGSTAATYGAGLYVSNTISPNAGASNLSFIDINGTVNQTGSASGITRGLYVRPTLTAAVDFRGIDLANNSGYGIYQGGANANNYFAGNVVVGSGKTVALTGGTTASRPGSPTEGMMYFDTDTDKLLVYANSKWQASTGEFVIVAASNSSQTIKDAAHFVADGNGGGAGDGDQIQINSALTAASGGRVYLAAGTYVADDSIVMPNNTALAGAGLGTVIELADLDVDEVLIQSSDTSQTINGITIRDMKLDGRDDLNTAGTQIGIRINNTTASANTNEGSLITNLVVEDFTNVGVQLDGLQRFTVSSNTFRSNGTQGLQMLMTNTSSSNNMFSGNNATSNGSNGIFIRSHNSTITGNTSTSNTSHGFVIQGAAITVNSNTATSNNRGFSLTDFNRSSLTGNTANSNTVRGIYLETSDFSTISSNSLYDNGGSGANDSIYLTTSDNNTISDNRITDTAGSGYAINISNSGSDTNYLSGNYYSGTGATTINDAGTGTIYGGQLSGSNYAVKASGTVELQSAANVTGNLLATGNLTIDTNTFFVNATTNRVGIGNTSPDAALEVTGDIYLSSGANRIIKMEDNGAGAGYDLSITGSNGSGNGGNIAIQAGSHGGFSSGGSVTITGGGGGFVNGNVNINGGTGGLFAVGAVNINNNVNSPTQINTGTSTGAVTIGNSAAGAIAIQTGSTLGLTGTTTITGRTTGAALVVNNSTSTGNILELQDNGVAAFTLADGGVATFANNVVLGAALPTGDTADGVCRSSVGVLSTCTSAARYKDNVSNLSIGLDEIRQLQPVSYTWNTNGRDDIGFIAEQVAAVIPQAVTYDENGDVASFNYNTVSALLVAGVKQLDVEMASNTARLTVVEQEVASLSLGAGIYATSESVQSMGSNLQSRLSVLEQGNFAQLTVSGSVSVAGNLEVVGSISASSIRLTGKLITAGQTPSASVLGTATGNVTVSGNDTAGEATFVIDSGTVPSSGQQFRVNFAQAFGAKPRVSATPTSSASSHVGYYVETDAGGFTVFFTNSPAPGQTYKFNYFAVQ